MDPRHPPYPEPRPHPVVRNPIPVRDRVSHRPRSARNRASARKAGTSFERLVADYLAAVVDDRIDRRVKTGPRDKGDIASIRIAAGRVVMETKDCVRLDLPRWAREAENERRNDGAALAAVAHKRRGVADAGSQWVTLTLAAFAELLRGAQ